MSTPSYLSRLMPSSLFSLLVLYCLPAFANQVVRHDFMVQNGSSIELFVREIVNSDAARNSSAPALLLIHGARVPGIASFDLPAPGGSLAADLAAQGLAVYVMDIRGYGSSTRPPEMSQSPAAHSSLVRSNDAVDDIAAVVDWIASRRHVSRVALFGWATGGQWAAHFASLHPDRVNALVLLNSLTGGSDQHSVLGHGSDSEDPTHPGRFNPASCGAYRFNDAASLLRAWDRSIPIADKSEWRDPAVSSAYVAAALASDPTSTSRTPPSFRSPCGALEDSFYLAVGTPLGFLPHYRANPHFPRCAGLLVTSGRRLQICRSADAFAQSKRRPASRRHSFCASRSPDAWPIGSCWPTSFHF